MRQTAVGFSAAALRKDFFDFVDPQDHRRHRFGEPGGLPKISLGLPDVLVVQPSGVEFEERHLPLPGDEFRGQRFSASLYPDDENPPRCLEIQITRRGCEADASPFQPGLQALESSELEFVAAGGKEFEHAAVLDHLALPLDDGLQVVDRELSVIDDCRRDDLARLVECEPRQCADNSLRIFAGQVDADALSRAHAFDYRADQVANFVFVRQFQLEPHRERVDVRGKLDRAAGQHEGGPRRGQLLGEIAQCPRDAGGREIGREVLQKIDAIAVDALDVPQSRQGVLRRVDRRSSQPPQPFCHGPFVER